jgi:hypothetical protein
MARTDSPSSSGASHRDALRDALRWGLLLAAVAVSGFRCVDAFRQFRNWRSTFPIDPSAADLYRLNLEVDVTGIVVVMAIGLGAFYLLRRSSRARR